MENLEESTWLLILQTTRTNLSEVGPAWRPGAASKPPKIGRFAHVALSGQLERRLLRPPCRRRSPRGSHAVHQRRRVVVLAGAGPGACRRGPTDFKPSP